MMNIDVKTLKEGDRFSKPVFVDEANIFVQENIPIKQKDIDRISRWGIKTLRTEGTLVSGGAGAAKPVSPSENAAAENVSFVNYMDSPVQQEILKVYQKLLEQLRGIQKDIRAQKPLENSVVNKIVDSLQNLLVKHRDELIQLILFGLPGKSDSAQNSLNTAILASIIGNAMNMIPHKLTQLITGALLHDMGMVRVPADILAKTGKLEGEDIGKMRAHTIHSYRIITKELGYPEEIGLAALQHHERWDGLGYPKKLAGKQINDYARVVAVADAFQAMISHRPYRDSMIGHTAMRSILSDNGRRFDPEILRVFVRCMGIYPLGSIVLLSTSCIGRVVENNPASPLRPKVKLMIDKNGVMLDNDKNEVIDLNSDKKVFITKAVDPKGVFKQLAQG
ncbi:MAG: HD-GYP domain-containing protein [Spirochaetales bacterium]|jgi:HD-GYP domain-containing protein (c-di-GMP phosphodiesterase class II)|nr:HD-GYP domain-containing protein [Spirochaetales bacterium]